MKFIENHFTTQNLQLPLDLQRPQSLIPYGIAVMHQFLQEARSLLPAKFFHTTSILLESFFIPHLSDTL